MILRMASIELFDSCEKGDCFVIINRESDIYGSYALVIIGTFHIYSGQWLTVDFVSKNKVMALIQILP
jgi:hypothetical protein